MFSSAGFTSPRGPFAGAAPLAHRPLSAIAATTAGGVPQARIQRIIAELIPVLDDLHRDGRICGDISVHSVGMDEAGRAHLMALSGYSRLGEPALTPGYAPFELYTEAPEWPRGPWTDIYALSAMAYSLVTGRRPPAASERRVSETYRPLAALGLAKYDASFLASIDAGLAIIPADRPQTMQAFADSLALPSAPQASQAVPAAAETVAPAVAAETPYTPRRGNFRSFMHAALLGIATLGVSAYWWGRLTKAPEGVITHSESALTQVRVPDTAVSPALSSPPSAAPAPAAVAPLAQWQTSYPTAEEAAAASALLAESAPDDKPAEAAPPPPPPPPSPVRVSINVRPWGEILVNGVSRGVTPPLKTLRLAPGKYSVTIRNTAQPPYRTTLEVKAGKPAMITHIFR
ncbi:hypothetical protein [Bordetella sp. BOR01]|uniref:hypothetical protein n=1 Tax=Bordetella sp. BOR01 TaxID=2854779 RepID=UPI001C48E344|nr:hypothetical protein [Bordetella sp. BOR01]MBV7485245.1 hypothetical protein [Bordetella sp. BOR01]